MNIVEIIADRLAAPLSLWLLYAFLYSAWGFTMNEIGKKLSIACFSHWWQVLTCYLLYMVPISLVLRPLPLHQQYLWGLLAFGILEFLGYWLETSKTLGITEQGDTILLGNNPLIRAFKIQNFTLGMTLFFALYFPIGNTVVVWLHGLLFSPST